VKLKSRTFRYGITMLPPPSAPAARTAGPIDSMLLRMKSGDSLKRKFRSERVSRPFSIRNVPSRVRPVIEDRPRVDLAQVPEPRDQHAARGGCDHLVHGGVPAHHHHRGRATGGLAALTLGPEAVVGEFAENAVLDPDAALHRHSLAVERVAEQLRVVRIGDQRDALVDDPLADPVAAARLGEGAAALVRAARVHGEAHQPDEVGDRLRLEDHRVAARLDRHRVAREARLLAGAACDPLRVDLAPVRVVRAGPPAAGAVGGAHGERVVGAGGAVVGEEAAVVAERAGAGRGHDEAGGLEVARGARHLQRGRRGPRARLGRQFRRCSRSIRARSRYCCGPSARHRLGVLRRQPRERLALANGAEQRLVREVVRRDHRAAPSERAGARRGWRSSRPAVDIRLLAKRVLPAWLALTLTWISSASTSRRCVPTSARASASDISSPRSRKSGARVPPRSPASAARRETGLCCDPFMSGRPPGVDHVDVSEAGRRAPVAHRVHLPGWPLPSKKLPPSW
jgi:hypothetical protein